MERIAILGSGFGLYGYLPAILQLGQGSVLLPKRYRDKFLQRSELSKFQSQITWVENEESALQSAEGAVLALSPESQLRWLQIALQKRNLRRLFLEKPLAPNPESAASVFQLLEASKKIIRIAYVFRYQDWANLLRMHLNQMSAKRISLRWHFRAHHHHGSDVTWKREQARGGGVMRFYGIHLIAMLSEFGYTDVESSKTTQVHAPGQLNSVTVDRWEATFMGPGLPRFAVELDCACPKTHFHIESASNGRVISLWSSPAPFCQTTEREGLDDRVSTLEQHCRTSWEDADCLLPSFYGSTIRLWRLVEEYGCYSQNVAA